MRIQAVLLGACFVVGSIFGPARINAQGDAGELTPELVVANIVARNPLLTTFQAHIDVQLHTGIPFLNPKLEGTTYFKRPDRYEVVFKKVPSFARGIDKLYSDIGDPASWSRRFVVTLAGHREYQGHRVVVLRLVQRVRGMIDHEEVLVDPDRWIVDEVDYKYYNGGSIMLEQVFRNEGGFSVLSEQHALITLPHIPRTRGDATYSDYHFNVSIDDAVFTERETKEMGSSKP